MISPSVSLSLSLSLSHTHTHTFFYTLSRWRGDRPQWTGIPALAVLSLPLKVCLPHYLCLICSLSLSLSLSHTHTDTVLANRTWQWTSLFPLSAFPSCLTHVVLDDSHCFFLKLARCRWELFPRTTENQGKGGEEQSWGQWWKRQ